MVSNSLYSKFVRLDLDLSCLGLEKGDEKAGYFCTPKGARIIGWAGVDGIHYCFVRGFKDMVFAVNPFGDRGNYVYPLAADFKDFLRLLLACEDTAMIRQIRDWNEDQFREYTRQRQEDRKADPEFERKCEETLARIAEAFSLEPMEDPYGYVKKIQAGFDDGKLRFSAEYREVTEEPGRPGASDWKVYASGSFFGHRKGERPGTAIEVNKEFDWNGEHWRIPAVYRCGSALVVDFCVSVPAERIRKFMNKWCPDGREPEGGTGREWSEEEREQIETENPLNIDVVPKIKVNDTDLKWNGSTACGWNPCAQARSENSPDARGVLEHYGCNEEDGWRFLRASFSWEQRRKKEIRKLSLHLERRPAILQGPHIKVTGPGQKEEFVHPLTGQVHTLTVQEAAQRKVPEERWFAGEPSGKFQFPRCYQHVIYTLSPELEAKQIILKDCARGDSPGLLPAGERCDSEESESAAASIGIIGGADGPTAVFMAMKDECRPQPLHAACSSLRFEPVEETEWRIVFMEKLCEDICVEIEL